MCERQISTWNGVLTCDVTKKGHPQDGSLHHAHSDANETLCPNERDRRHTFENPHFPGHRVANPALDIDWPSEWSPVGTKTVQRHE